MFFNKQPLIHSWFRNKQLPKKSVEKKNPSNEIKLSPKPKLPIQLGLSWAMDEKRSLSSYFNQCNKKAHFYGKVQVIVHTPPPPSKHRFAVFLPGMAGKVRKTGLSSSMDDFISDRSSGESENSPPDPKAKEPPLPAWFCKGYNSYFPPWHIASSNAWTRFLRCWWGVDELGFLGSVKKQLGKKQVYDQTNVDLNSALSHIKSNTEHTISINLAMLPTPMICIDIDNSHIGKKIIEAFKNPKAPSHFIKTFRHPIVVETETPGHVHLYYELPWSLGNVDKFKKKLPTRLGFEAEYIYTTVTFAGANWKLIYAPRLNEIDPLPQELWPYNYPRTDGLYWLMYRPSPSEENKSPEDEPVERERNSFLFQFFWIDIFELDHMKTTNDLCLWYPLPHIELASIHKSIKKTQSKKREHTYHIDFYGRFTLIDEKDYDAKEGRLSSGFENEWDKRINKAYDLKTPKETVEFVQYVEKYHRPFRFEDTEWMGRTVLQTIIVFLIKSKWLIVNFVDSEQSFLIWTGKHWSEKKEMALKELIYSLVSDLNFGGLEGKIVGKEITAPIRNCSTVTNWINQLEVKGHAYLNGVARYVGKELILVPHEPDYQNRKLYQCDYIDKGALAIECHALISDLCHGNIYHMHLLRFLGWLTLTSGYGNCAFYIFGPSGGAKTTLTMFLREFYPFLDTGSIDDAALKKSGSIKSAVVKGKRFLLLPDLSPSTLSGPIKEFCKTTVGSDIQVTDVKWSDALLFIAQCILIITSNYPPNKVAGFKDEGLDNRMIRMTVPQVDTSCRIHEVGNLLRRNKNQFAHWCMNIDHKLCKKCLRSDGVNAITNIDRSSNEEFILENIAYQKGKRVTSKELGDALRNYRISTGEHSEKHPPDYSNVIGRAMNDISSKIITSQSITNYKTAKERGYENISIRPSSGALLPEQEPLQLKIDYDLKEILNSNPFQNHGYCYFNETTGFTQHPPEDQSTTVQNTILAKSVAEVGIGPAHIINGVPFGKKPFDHLYNNMVFNSEGEKLWKAKSVAHYPIIDLWSKDDPSKYIGKYELEKIFEKIWKDISRKDKFRRTKTFHLTSTEQESGLNLCEDRKAVSDDKIRLRRSKTFKFSKIEIEKSGLKIVPIKLVKLKKSKTFKITDEHPLGISESIEIDLTKNIKKENQSTTDKQDPSSDTVKRSKSVEEKSIAKEKPPQKPKEKPILIEDPPELQSESTSGVKESDKKAKPKPVKKKRGRPSKEKKVTKNKQEDSIQTQWAKEKKTDSFKQESSEQETAPSDEEGHKQITIQEKPINWIAKKEELKFAQTFKYTGNLLTTTDFDPERYISSNSSLLAEKDESKLFSNCLNIVSHNKSFMGLSIRAYFFEAKIKYASFTDKLRNRCNNWDYIWLYLGVNFPYADASLFEEMINSFRTFPIHGTYELINQLNYHFAPSILDAWALNNKCRNWTTAEYYGKALPGTSESAGKETIRNLLSETYKVPNFDTNNFLFVNNAWSLFPFLYTKGREGYGWAISIPGSNISTLKSTCKFEILKWMAAKINLNFIELDVKSCHSVVARAFLQKLGYSLPEAKNHWSSIMDQFKSVTQKITTEDHVSKNIRSWDGQPLKALIKTQWYKALNGGSCFNAHDNLDSNKFKLNIDNESLPLYYEPVRNVLKEITLFKGLGQLQHSLNNLSEIYFPTQEKPFDTSTPSASQQASDRIKGPSMTAMSRLFTHCEMAIITMVFIELAKLKYSVIPISYEADGLLLIGDFKKENLDEMIQEINERFGAQAAKLFNEKYEFEFKNNTCQ